MNVPQEKYIKIQEFRREADYWSVDLGPHKRKDLLNSALKNPKKIHSSTQPIQVFFGMQHSHRIIVTHITHLRDPLAGTPGKPTGRSHPLSLISGHELGWSCSVGNRVHTPWNHCNWSLNRRRIPFKAPFLTPRKGRQQHCSALAEKSTEKNWNPPHLAFAQEM